MESADTVEKQDRPWLFKKGQSGNPSGKKKGTVSLKTWAKKYLQTLSDEDKLTFMEGLPKEIIWKMAEGNPHSTQDTNVDGNITIQGVEISVRK
jgi:hypothetical protein